MGKGAGREIFFPEEVLLQLSGMVREKKIVEPAAVILKPFGGQGFDRGHESIHGAVLEIGFFKLLEPVHEVLVFLFCISRFCQKEKGIEIGLFRGDAFTFQVGGKKGAGMECFLLSEKVPVVSRILQGSRRHKPAAEPSKPCQVSSGPRVKKASSSMRVRVFSSSHFLPCTRGGRKGLKRVVSFKRAFLKRVAERKAFSHRISPFSL